MMRPFNVRVYPSREKLPREKQLAWALAELAHANRRIDPEAGAMVVNRIIDNAAVAVAAINRPPVIAARQQALAHPRKNGATLIGLGAGQTFECEWAAWANAAAVRELDMHDTFLAADYSHPGDTIAPILAVAQQTGKSGEDFILAILTAYEVQINLVKGICLHAFKKDHIAHLAPAVAAGLGTLLRLDIETIFQAVNQSVHLAFSTRQSRKGEISSWKACAPAWAGKLAIEAVDRAMRGEKSPSPIYEGEDSVLAWMLGGKEQVYVVPLPEPGEPFRAILESYTKEHSAEYQAQALIDLAFDLHRQNIDVKNIREIVIQTSRHTHHVIGTGSNDPQKFDPAASRETLDHSAMYIFAVALEDGRWRHEESYARERAGRPSTVELWRKIRTEEKKEWTEAYHHPDPARKKFGAEVVITFKDGRQMKARRDNPRAHPCGAKPFQREDYIEKFKTLTKGLVSPDAAELFLKDAAAFRPVTPVVLPGKMQGTARDNRGIF